jgi:RNA-directed DNA polymerase
MIAQKAIHIPHEKVRVFQRKLYLSAKANPKRKFGVLYDKIYRQDVLEMAWQNVRANKGSAGIDKQTIQNVEEYGIRKLLGEISDSLLQKKYHPQPVRRVYIPKADGKKRPLGIPTVKDRIIQTAMKIVIEPIFESGFAPFSYGFRPKRSAGDALKEIYKYINFGCRWVVDADLKAYFDTISHDKLIKLVKLRVIDKSVIKLLELWLRAGIMDDKTLKQSFLGTPQGGVISPLLANIYLNALDQLWVKQRYDAREHDAHLVRYADDFVILCAKNPERYFEIAKQRLTRLDLVINEEKTKIKHATEGFTFLGHTFMLAPSKKTGKLKCYYYPSDKAMRAIKSKVKTIVGNNQHKSVKEVAELLNPVIRGWGNYYQDGNARERFTDIDTYVIRTLAIMLRKKHQKRSKGWRDHPPSWFYDNHKLYSLKKSISTKTDIAIRYGRTQ